MFNYLLGMDLKLLDDGIIGVRALWEGLGSLFVVVLAIVGPLLREVTTSSMAVTPPRAVMLS